MTQLLLQCVAPLTAAYSALAASGNSSYGWFGGGSDASYIKVSSVDRIDYANDTITAAVRGSLSAARDSIGATQNSPLA